MLSLLLGLWGAGGAVWVGNRVIAKYRCLWQELPWAQTPTRGLLINKPLLCEEGKPLYLVETSQ